ncbi:PREDICTED: mitochondrial inner membrane protease ATP23 homolog [Nicrophorus vespilloides]|uniref:Mitochondrial inner membrane protease ATP23 n=1 Tax=Nicrophorus vespilloides TaxID=110193 RepID=A0ABM1MFF9_NICVS|nr:PREDICTED: mitochondrial inner membrane protease ATP23 homolog [Nicrophorus vespilloides]
MNFLDELTKSSEKPKSEPIKKEEPAPKKEKPEGGVAWGYDLYPERRKESESRFANLMHGRDNLEKIRCERNVYKCIKTSPLVKLMMGALKSSGCPMDIRRHIACEECHPSVSGGYDPVLNQIVVCQNMATNEGLVQGVLTHEMIHMFDYCRNDLNFKNIDHLACTEIRAANLAHCSFVSAWMQGDTSFFNFKESHQNCVKSKALKSVLSVRTVSTEEAIEAVERVFPKCYKDLEPIGRRIKRNSNDMYMAYAEGYLYGYDN